MDQARKLVDPPTIVPQWNDAVSLVITGKAGANVMGDWAQGEFQVANMKCRHGLRLPRRPRHHPDAQHRRRRVLLPEEQTIRR